MEAGASKKEPKAESKGADDELSMEEILQSIRRIIADDEGDAKKPAAEEKKTNGKGKTMEDDVPGSDMLELTDMLKEDGTVVNLKKDSGAAKPVVEEATSFDILTKIDEALPEKPAMPEVMAVSPMITPEPVAAAPAPAAASAQDAIDSLLSAEAAQATADAFKRLKTPEPEQPAYVPSGSPLPPFRSGATVEDMVSEMLRPMLKQWLDTNLPQMVQQIVEREVRKLTK